MWPINKSELSLSIAQAGKNGQVGKSEKITP